MHRDPRHEPDMTQATKHPRGRALLDIGTAHYVAPGCTAGKVHRWRLNLRHIERRSVSTDTKSVRSRRWSVDTSIVRKPGFSLVELVIVVVSMSFMTRRGSMARS